MTNSPAPITDAQGRTFKTLRISLTGVCNLGCVYCTDDTDTSTGCGTSLFSDPEKIAEAVEKIHRLTPLASVRLTGGEPLLYPHLEDLIRRIRQAGIGRIKMTSNASLLGRKAQSLKAAGLDEVNISLDAIDDAIYRAVTRRKNREKVLEGIFAAQEAGLDIKLNAVVMKGLNDNQIIPLLEFARNSGLAIRFLEVMEMGYLHSQFKAHLFPQEAILQQIAEKYDFVSLGRKPGHTAQYWMMPDGFRFGIIANTSAPFCSDCNRLRLDSNGRIYGCLSNNKGIRIAEGLQDPHRMQQLLTRALHQKQQTHFTGSSLSMKNIGG